MKPVWANNARSGELHRYIKLAFFACEGLIAIHDDRDDSYVAVTPADFEDRVRSLVRQSNQAKAESELTPAQRQYRKELKAFGNNAEAACKEARYMGDPSDPQVQAFWARHRRHVQIPTGPQTDAAGYPEFPAMPRGQFTGRTVQPDAVAAVPTIHVPPRRKNRSGLVFTSDAL